MCGYGPTPARPQPAASTASWMAAPATPRRAASRAAVTSPDAVAAASPAAAPIPVSCGQPMRCHFTSPLLFKTRTSMWALPDESLALQMNSVPALLGSLEGQCTDGLVDPRVRVIHCSMSRSSFWLSIRPRDPTTIVTEMPTTNATTSRLPTMTPQRIGGRCHQERGSPTGCQYCQPAGG